MQGVGVSNSVSNLDKGYEGDEIDHEGDELELEGMGAV